MANEVLSGTFLACYEIGNEAPGAPVCTVHLVVSPSPEPEIGTVHGVGHITQTTNPPLNLPTMLNGNFVTVLVMGVPQVSVTATGYPIIHWQPQWGIGPVLQPNVQLHMTLSGDWKSGTATYTYTDANGSHTVQNVPVRSIRCTTFEQ